MVTGMLLAPQVIAANAGRMPVWVPHKGDVLEVMRGMKMGIAAAAAVCVVGCANGSAGLSSPSPVAVATPSVPSSCTVPGAPSDLSADVTGSSVSLSWSGVSDASDYLVLIGWTPTSAETLLTNTAASSHSIAEIPAGRHFARVHAHNWCGTSASTPPIAFTVN
jgi:hypothetical protein